MKQLRAWIIRRLCRPSNSLMLLAAFLLALDHRFSVLTSAGLSLMAGAFLARKIGG